MKAYGSVFCDELNGGASGHRLFEHRSAWVPKRVGLAEGDDGQHTTGRVQLGVVEARTTQRRRAVMRCEHGSSL